MGWVIAFPVKIVTHDACLERHGGVVSRVHQVGMLAIKSEVLAVPLEMTHHLACIGVQQQFVGVEPVAMIGVPLAMRAQAVEQTGLCAGQISVPYITGVGRQTHARHFDRARFIKQTQFHGLRMGRENRKIDTPAIPAGAHGPRMAI